MKTLLRTDEVFTVTELDLTGVESPDPEVTYTLRSITQSVLREMEARHTSRRPDTRTGTMVEKIDVEAVNEDCLDYAITAWSGITWDGEPAPCTREMKAALDVSQKRAILYRCLTTRRQDAARGESFRPPA